MSDVIRWEEPPPSRGAKFDTVVERLKSARGKWALVQEGVTPERAEQSTAQVLRRKGCRAVTRRLEDGTASVWACFPEEGDEAS